MGAGDGTVIGITKIEDNGSRFHRFNLVLVSEGYQSTEMTQFATDAANFVNHLFSMDPFGTYRSAFNVYRLDVSSDDSGADDPAACGGSGTSVDTFFDASFCNGGIRRLLTANTALVTSTVNGLLPEWDQIIVIVNSPIWGGAGGSIAVTSTAPGWMNVAVHEMGHAAFSLADEYEYWAGCGIDTTQDNYTGAEPSAANVTTNTDRNTMKWRTLVNAGTPMPTTSNADCSSCDPQASPVPAGTVGTFEGAYYHHCGAYRPEFNCMMRNLTDFCAVCQRRIRFVLEPFMPREIIPPDDLPEDPGRWWFEPREPEWWEFREFVKPEMIQPRWILVAYLIINWRMRELTNQLKFKPDKVFFDTVVEHLGNYLVRDKLPPDKIRGAILNLADDYIAKQPMQLRAGDYLAIQNFIRENR